jgi:hypothetical protein
MVAIIAKTSPTPKEFLTAQAATGGHNVATTTLLTTTSLNVLEMASMLNE